MIKVNELFAGIGAFRKALINLDIPHEIVGISETCGLMDFLARMFLQWGK